MSVLFQLPLPFTILPKSSVVYLRYTPCPDVNSGSHSAALLRPLTFLYFISTSPPCSFSTLPPVNKPTLTCCCRPSSSSLSRPPTHYPALLNILVSYLPSSFWSKPLPSTWEGLTCCYITNSPPYYCTLPAVVYHPSLTSYWPKPVFITEKFPFTYFLAFTSILTYQWPCGHSPTLIVYYNLAKSENQEVFLLKHIQSGKIVFHSYHSQQLCFSQYNF